MTNELYIKLFKAFVDASPDKGRFDGILRVSLKEVRMSLETFLSEPVFTEDRDQIENPFLSISRIFPKKIMSKPVLTILQRMEGEWRETVRAFYAFIEDSKTSEEMDFGVSLTESMPEPQQGGVMQQVEASSYQQYYQHNMNPKAVSEAIEKMHAAQKLSETSLNPFNTYGTYSSWDKPIQLKKQKP